MTPSGRALFPTTLYEAGLAASPDFTSFNAELAAACRMLEAEDQAGRRWCRENGYRGYTSYASLADLPTRASVFGDLKRRLDGHVRAFATLVDFDLGGGRLKLDDLWVNILKPGGVHSGHLHPNSVVSGTVYVATPPGSGALRFEDPRLPMMMAAPPRRGGAFIYVEPAAGTLFLWESWLRHEVMPNRGKGDRISLSFNYRWG